MSDKSVPVGRRTVLRGVAAGSVAVPLLAACAGEEAGAPSGVGSPSGSEVEVSAADVPVGGGTILEEELVVVTQPTEGEFKAFSAVCTHQGCPVQEIADGTINCQCHGSRFSIEDGSVVQGPADAPLGTKKATLQGDTVRVS